MNLRGIILTIYMLVSVLLFIFFRASPTVWISFLGNGTLLLGITIYHLYYEKTFSPFLSSFIVFNFLFFLVAPMVQIDSFYGLEKPKFANFFPYEERLTLFTNVLIFIFNAVFFVSYVGLKKKMRPTIIEYKSLKSNILPLTIVIVLVLSIAIFLSSFNFTLEEIRTPNWIENNVSVFELLLWKKVLFLVPLGGIILCFYFFQNGSKIEMNKLVVALSSVVFILLIFWFKNPFTEKRNSLGPVYICLLFLFLPKLLNSNAKMLAFLFFTMIIVFPLTSIFTHTDATFAEIYSRPMILLDEMKGGGIIKTFSTLHYDAFSNIMATIDYVLKNGFSFGFQLLSAFLFFIPRSIWEWKPNSTGKLIGEYLIDDYNFQFSNLSNPLVSEGYINFGVIGVILGAIILAYVIVLMLRWFNSDHYLRKYLALYFAVHLMFLLRGDFTNGFAYFIGALLGTLVIPLAIEYILKRAFIKKADG